MESDAEFARRLQAEELAAISRHHGFFFHRGAFFNKSSFLHVRNMWIAEVLRGTNK